MPDEIPDAVLVPGKWERAKKWAKTAWDLNRRAYALWLAACVGVMVDNCTNAPGEPDRPLPPLPDFIFPESAGKGWIPPEAAERDSTLALLPTPRWENTEASGLILDDTDAPLWKMYSAIPRGGPVPAHNQGEIGSCVSFGTALAAEFSLAFQIHYRRGPPQSFEPNVREAIYGGSRINVDPRNPINNGDGSTGSRAAKWLSKGVGGLLPIGDNGAYSVSRCREWGNRGVPASLVAKCKGNPCQTTLVTSAAAAKEAIKQGYAIFVCCDVGFGDLNGGPIPRDADGFLRPKGIWYHCQAITGYQGGARPGFLVTNSWGAGWVTGPVGKYADTPPGSYWVDASVADRMLSQQDSYAVAGVEGFRRRKLEESDWVVSAKKDVMFEPLFALAP